MKLIFLTLKEDLGSPRWKHCVSTIKKGTLVSCKKDKDGRIFAHHNKETVSIIIEAKNANKYFSAEDLSKL